MKIFFVSQIPIHVRNLVYTKYLAYFDETKCPTCADIVVVDVHKTSMEHFPKSKFIVCPATNTLHIEDIAPYHRLISIKDKPLVTEDITSTAEHTLCLMLMLMRRVNQKLNTFSRYEYLGNTLVNKTLGIIGYGRVGKQVAAYAKAFKMNVLHVDKNETLSNTTKDHLLKNSDIISIHIAVDKNQESILNEDEFKSLKQGSFLINTSRGQALDEDLLIRYSHKFQGIALDVLQGEPEPPRLNALKAMSNTIITPHIGGCTVEDMKKAADHCFEVLMGEIYDSTAE